MTKVVATKLELYQATDGWRFRIRAGNGEIIATGEAYKNKNDCIAAAAALVPHLDPVEVGA